MRRRDFVGHAFGLVASMPVLARAQGRQPARVGWLAPGNSEPDWTLFRKAMADHGWIEDKTIAYEYRTAGSDLSRIDALAAELVQLKVDLIVAYFTPAIKASRKATSTIPIVFTGGAVDAGMVGSFAQPAGNLTGIARGGTVLGAKCVQLIHEVLPQARRIAGLFNAPDPYSVPFRRVLQKAADTSSFQLEVVTLNSPSELQSAFDKLAVDRPDALVVQPSLPIKDVARLALEHHLPAVSPGPRFAEFGGLFAYHADEADIERTVADYASKILKGAKIADLPVQEEARFKLVINQKTAQALGLTLPLMVLALADKVIE